MQEINLIGTITIAGGSAPVLEEITVRSKPGQDQEIVPSEGVDGYNKIKVRRTPLTTKVINPTTQAQTYRASDDDVQGYSMVTVGAMNLESKTVTPTSQQQIIVPSQGWDGMSQVTVNAATDKFNDLLNDGVNTQNIIMSDNNNAHICYGMKGGINLVLSDTIISIDSAAFSNANFLKGIYAPGVTEVKSYAFSNCYNLDSVNMPVLQTVDEGAFSNIANGSNNKSYMFPSLSHIKSNAFLGSYNIKDIYIGYNGLCVLDNKNAFDTYGISAFNIHVPSTVLSLYQSDATWQEAVTAGYITLVGDYSA